MAAAAADRAEGRRGIRPVHTKNFICSKLSCDFSLLAPPLLQQKQIQAVPLPELRTIRRIVQRATEATAEKSRARQSLAGLKSLEHVKLRLRPPNHR